MLAAGTGGDMACGICRRRRAGVIRDPEAGLCTYDIWDVKQANTSQWRFVSVCFLKDV